METRLDLMIVDDTHFYRVGAKLAHAGDMDLAELLVLVADLPAKHVWVVTGSMVSQVCSVPCEIPGWNVTAIFSSTAQDRYSFLSARRNDARADSMIYIGFPEWSRWPWKKSSSSARGLLATVAYLEDGLGLPLEWTPAHMAMEYVRKLNADRWSWLAPLTFDLEEKQAGFRYANTCPELHWKADSPVESRYLVRIDCNSAYAAAMLSLNIGEKNPVHVWAPGYDGKAPGFWRVECQGSNPMFDKVAKLSWMTTDLIEQLRAVGYKVDIQEGWMWEKYHQTLRSTAETLWEQRVTWRSMRNTRRSSQDVIEAVYESYSAIIKAVHGRFGRKANDKAREQRRDIWALVVSRSIALMIYRIMKIYREYGILPIAIKADELTYAVSDHQIDKMLDRDKLGGFKLVEVIGG